jgi:hypothetical protein
MEEKALHKVHSTHTLNDNQHVRCVHISASQFQRGRTEKTQLSFLAFWQWMSHGCTTMILNWSNNTENGIFWCQSGSILKDTMHYEGLVLDQAVPSMVLTILNKCKIMWHDLHDKEPQLVQCGMVLHQDNVTCYRHNDIPNLLQGMFSDPPYSPNVCSANLILFPCTKQQWWGCRLMFCNTTNSPSQSLSAAWAATTTGLQVTS